MSSVANVVIPPLIQSYSYIVPEHLCSEICMGSYVEVPLGNRKVQGFIVGLGQQESVTDQTYTLKPVHKIISRQSFNPDQIALFEWTARYYSVGVSSVIDTAVPSFVAPKVQKVIELVLPASSEIKSQKQKEIIDFISTCGGKITYSLLSKRFKNCRSSLQSLEKQNHICVSSQTTTTFSEINIINNTWAKREVELNQEQLVAYNKVTNSICAQEHVVYLLHGVTGSGKTEVYIEAARMALEQDKGALIIVPEIALTPQLIARFQARLGNNIAILHSAMSKRARWENWASLLDGSVKIAIGARSAVFAPVKNIGLIVVDEEHDGSYKQAEGLRYNARDLAVLRSRLQNCPVILGSATPSLETFHNALRNKYKYIYLSSRHSSGSALQIELVDLNQTKPWDMPAQNISPRLYEAMQSTLKNSGQVFILYNRRGFASYLQCEKCSHSMQCPNCTVTLTYHQSRHKLQCHYCNLSLNPSTFCPACQSSKDKKLRAEPGKLIQRGAGTEKIFDEIRELFPEYKTARLDRDVVNDQASYQEIFDELRSGKIKILVGTQMIAKGHDLPNVQLVGIADCDVGLHMPDFRSSERIFQLLTQAAGRAGRGDTIGQVVLQTRVPSHISLTHTLQKDFSGFAKLELRKRKDAMYPPYTKLLRVLASSLENQLVVSSLNSIKEALVLLIEKEQLKIVVLGPAPAPISRIKNQFRWHILIKSQSTNDLQKAINLIRKQKSSSKVKLIIDRDPQELL